MKTKAFLKSRDQRKPVEMRFAHLKTHHGFASQLIHPKTSRTVGPPKKPWRPEFSRVP